MTGKVVKEGGRILGMIEGDTFYKRVNRTKHLLRKPRRSWALSMRAFSNQVLTHTTFMVFEEEETGCKYRCQTLDFARHGFEIHYEPYEPQLALELKYWEVEDPRARQLALSLGGVDA